MGIASKPKLNHQGQDGQGTASQWKMLLTRSLQEEAEQSATVPRNLYFNCTGGIVF